MLWPSDKYDVAFSKIVDALSGGLRSCTGAGPDALASHLICAAQVEDVQFQVKPVGGYDDLLAAHEDIVRAGGMELRSVVLLGCGAMLNLSEAFPLPDDITCYVIDSHRPIDHRNVHCDAQYVLFSDVLLDQEDFPSDDEDDEIEGTGLDNEGASGAGGADGSGFMEDDSDLESDSDKDSDEDGEQELGGGLPSSSSSISALCGCNAPLLAPHHPGCLIFHQDDSEALKRKRGEDEISENASGGGAIRTSHRGKSADVSVSKSCMRIMLAPILAPQQPMLQ